MTAFFQDGLAGVLPEAELVASWYRPELRQPYEATDHNGHLKLSTAMDCYEAARPGLHRDEFAIAVYEAAYSPALENLKTLTERALDVKLFEIYAPIVPPKPEHFPAPIFVPKHVTNLTLTGAEKLGLPTPKQGLFLRYTATVVMLAKAAWHGEMPEISTGSELLDSLILEFTEAAHQFAISPDSAYEQLRRSRWMKDINYSSLSWRAQAAVSALEKRPLTERVTVEEVQEAASQEQDYDDDY